MDEPLREEVRKLVDAMASTQEGFEDAQIAWAAESNLRATRREWEVIMPIDGLPVAAGRLGGA